jgi:hypothetical protein
MKIQSHGFRFLDEVFENSDPRVHKSQIAFRLFEKVKGMRLDFFF